MKLRILDLSMHQAIPLQFTQLLGEHFLGDQRDTVLQLAEAQGLLQQVPEDQALPFSADNFEGQLDTTTILSS